MKKTILFVIFWLIASAFIYINNDVNLSNSSKDIWLPSVPGNIADEPQVSLQILNDQNLEISISFAGVWASSIQNEAGLFTKLYLESYGQTGTPGQPDLPVFTTQILVPLNSKPTLEISNIKTRKIKLSDTNLPETVLPIQLPSPKSAPQPPWTPPDPGVYDQNEPYPINPADILPSYTMRANTLQPIQIFPVQYLPESGEIILIQNITLQIHFNGPIESKSISNRRLQHPEFDLMANELVLNPKQASASVDDLTPVDGGSYLIISPDAFIPALQPLVNLKTYEGYQVTVASLTEIGGSTTTAIKAFIQSAYFNWSTPPAYLLLVGDTDNIPAWKSDTYEIRNTKGTDLYYATMNGGNDYVPDILTGRLPARSNQQLTDMVNKIVSYALKDGTESWVKKAAFIATCDASYYPIAEGTHNYVISNYTLPLGYTGNFPVIGQTGGDKLYCQTYSPTKPTDVITAINDQRALLTYSGHGYITSWTEFFFTQDTIRTLEDNQTYPLVSSFACETNDFANTSYNEVFGETWILQPQKGAVTFIGSVDYSYWEQDDYLERSMYDHLFSNPIEPPTIASAMHYGLGRVQVFYPGRAQYYWETYNMLGDPSTRIWVGPRAQDFWMVPENSEISICSNSQINTEIDITPINQFSDIVTFTPQNLPASVSGWLTPNSIVPPETTDLTLNAASDTIPGNYSILINASSGDIQHYLPLSLSVHNFIPSTVNLIQPTDDSTSSTLYPAFQWQPVSQAFHYHLQVATDSTFSNLVIDQPELTGTGYTPTTPLESNTVYFWRVAATNACGASAFTNFFRFQTQPAAFDCISPELTQIIYQNDFESDISDWAITSPIANYDWFWATSRSHSPSLSFFASTPAVVSDQRLTSQPIFIPADSQLSTLRFWQWRDMESNFDGCNDGGMVEYNIDGSNWLQFSEDRILNGPTPLSINSLQNPLYGSNGWCGTDDWQQTIINLSSLQGQNVQFRFRVGTDSSTSKEGWYIDDFRLQTCQVLYKFSTDSSLTAQNQFSGLTASYPITITNHGDTDSYSVSLDGNQWDTETSTIPVLDFLDTATLWVQVHIPTGLTNGEDDLVTITITSNNDPTQYEEIVLTTTAIENHPLYMPVILK